MVATLILSCKTGFNICKLRMFNLELVFDDIALCRGRFHSPAARFFHSAESCKLVGEIERSAKTDRNRD